ncbi:uncharacterized protein LOC110093128 [Dendrobium catenatum]|uniref:uncharacterized protein LOC110093128 n=1 Tax=Dendrobium catenatum TaxID=906689 RepID=UPI0009F6377C|nr:uncharacterized protein LOC110093128 [Dendrobium catenatum]
MPNLPLQSWDEINICRIASKIGKPILIDANMFQWGRREFGRICVRINLDTQLPLGVWVEGSTGKFFHKLEYERLPNLCFDCGKLGHLKKDCKDKNLEGINGPAGNNVVQDKNSLNTNNTIGSSMNAEKTNEGYGPWLLVNYGKKKFINFGFRNFISRSKEVKGSNDAVGFSDNSNQSLMKNGKKIWKEVGLMNTENSIGLDKEDLEPRQKPECYYWIKDNQLEEGEIVNSGGILDFVNRDDLMAVNFTQTDGLADKEDVMKKDNSSNLKRKGSNQLKGLGPFKLAPRSRRAEGDVKDKGARKRKASLYLKEVVKNHGIFFIGLLETKVMNFDRKDVDLLIGPDWDFFHVPSDGLSGGLLVLWKANFVRFHIVEFCSQFILGDLDIPNKGILSIASIYGKKDVYKRRRIWERLEVHSSKDLPMVLGGDFNCILSKDDKREGKRFLFSLGPKEMKSFLAVNDFHEVGFVGSKFTWCNNKKGGDRILERLDRCFLNSVALNSPHRLLVRHLARISSDHCPVVLNLMVQNSAKKFLRFEEVWASNKASMAVIKGTWRKEVDGSFSQILNLKMEKTLKNLYYWSKAKHISLVKLKEDLLKIIENLQTKEANEGALSEEESWLLKVKVGELNSTLAKLDTWWRQRAKVKWLVEGDRNSRFFQAYASA